MGRDHKRLVQNGLCVARRERRSARRDVRDWGQTRRRRAICDVNEERNRGGLVAPKERRVVSEILIDERADVRWHLREGVSRWKKRRAILRRLLCTSVRRVYQKLQRERETYNEGATRGIVVDVVRLLQGDC